MLFTIEEIRTDEKTPSFLWFGVQENVGGKMKDVRVHPCTDRPRLNKSPHSPGGGEGDSKQGRGWIGGRGGAGGYRPDSGPKSKIINISERFL